ncbi:MAG: hypothetical protein OEZ01_12445 [Candidatus Heimdallarchaeota archaeon]|nr:hypothetical protein [Candidatus Heimdallarchaeota archaeon]MDH5646815.1 hypothetical protein [Candidatus Heimdallarchaeota archaeon]
MSRSKEDVQAYTRLLKFQNKRYGVASQDYIILLITLGITIFTGNLIQKNASANFGTIMFGINGIFILILIMAFFDYASGIGVLHENGMIYSSIIILSSLAISVIIAIFADTLFIINQDLIGLLNLINLLFVSIISSYYIITATPKREGREEIIEKLKEIRRDVAKLSLGELGIDNAIDRGYKWILLSQKDDGIWGEEYPLYETAEVLRTLTAMGKERDFSWSSNVKGKQVTRTVEQIYYLVFEALESAVIEPKLEYLIPVISICEIDAQHISIDREIYKEFTDDLYESSEWDFVRSLELFDKSLSTYTDIPAIFAMAPIFYYKNNLEIAQKCSDIFTNTFGILINRASTRFNIQGEKEIANLLLGIMYNSLITLIRGKRKATQDLIFQNDFSDASNKTEFELPNFDDTSFELPDLDSSSFELPDFSAIDKATESSISTQNTDKIKVGISVASIRNFLRSRQSIDGSWDGKIDVTAECLQAVSDQESSESDFIKAAVQYLLALQEKNGSWQNDIVLTAKVVRSLSYLNRSLDFGDFQ